MKHLSCLISGALPKDETSGQLQASTYSAMLNLQIGVKNFQVYMYLIEFCIHFLNDISIIFYSREFRKGVISKRGPSNDLVL